MKKCVAFVLAAIIGIGLGLTASVVFQIEQISDSSMEPEYKQGDKLLINRIAYIDSKPERGDVVVFPCKIYSLTGEDYLMKKRVIATEGENIRIDDGKVYINDKILVRPYTANAKEAGTVAAQGVASGSVFVLGDNLNASTDSRDITCGQVKINDILGKVILKW